VSEEAGEAPQLVDGSAPATPAELFARLDALGIPHRTVQHPPVFTVEEAQQHRGDEPGAHIKNLFFKTKKGMALLVCLEDRALDLKPLGALLELGRLSFGRPPRLMSYLGVTPGSVTGFALINDPGPNPKTRFLLDKRLTEVSPIHFHPLINDATTAIAPQDFLKFVTACGHEVEIVDFTQI